MLFLYWDKWIEVNTSFSFPSSKNVILYIPKNKVKNSEDECINSGINTSNIRSVDKGQDRNCSKQSDTNEQKPTTWNSQGQDAGDDNDSIDLFLSVSKSVDEFEERLEQL